MRGAPRLSPWFIDCKCGALKALSTSAMFTVGSCMSIAQWCVARRRWRDRLWARGCRNGCPTMGRSRPSAARRALATYRQGRRRSVSGPCLSPPIASPLNPSLANSTIRASNSNSAAPAGRSKLCRLAALHEQYSISSIDADSQARPIYNSLSATEHYERPYLILQD